MRPLAVAISFTGLFLLATPARRGEVRVDGIVRDASGAMIPSIEVKLRCQTFTSFRVTDPAGGFGPDTIWSR